MPQLLWSVSAPQLLHGQAMHLCHSYYGLCLLLSYYMARPCTCATATMVRDCSSAAGLCLGVVEGPGCQLPQQLEVVVLRDVVQHHQLLAEGGGWQGGTQATTT